jgi:hypothetical protein
MRFVGSNSKFNQVRRLIISALLMCAGTVAGEKHKYLAVAGPTPLRFRVATLQYDPGKVLPPLKMADAPITNTVETVTASEPSASKPVEPPAVTSEPAAPVHTAPVMPQVSTPTPEPNTPEARSESSQMTPQMLLRYFNKDGTREVVVPTTVEFTPPPPASSGSRSSAVYTSPPAK